jgi:hypothetical protein
VDVLERRRRRLQHGERRLGADDWRCRRHRHATIDRDHSAGQLHGVVGQSAATRRVHLLGVCNEQVRHDLFESGQLHDRRRSDNDNVSNNENDHDHDSNDDIIVVFSNDYDNNDSDDWQCCAVGFVDILNVTDNDNVDNDWDCVCYFTVIVIVAIYANSDIVFTYSHR